jgi:cytochrome c biogenesis protein CcmG/thiol:disulfide interchange protein DsbE
MLFRGSIRLLLGPVLGLALLLQGCGTGQRDLGATSKAGAPTAVAQAVSSAPTTVDEAPTVGPAPMSTPMPEPPAPPTASAAAIVATPTATPAIAAAPAPLISLGGGPAVGQPAPDFTLVGLDGKTIRLSDFRGQPVVVTFFATWCGPCTEELPRLQATYQQDRAKGLHVLLVDLKEPPAEVQAFAKKLGLSMPIAVDEKGIVASHGYALTNIPATYFIDGNGVIRGVHFGPVATKTLADNVDSLLAGANATVASSRQVPAGCCPAP